jgi:hypothetical protein
MLAFGMKAPPEWSHDDCVMYESAREILSSLVGFRSMWIAREEAKAEPDASLIAAWEAETDELVAQMRGLLVTDRDRVDHVRKKLGPEVKRLIAEERERLDDPG